MLHKNTRNGIRILQQAGIHCVAIVQPVVVTHPQEVADDFTVSRGTDETLDNRNASIDQIDACGGADSHAVIPMQWEVKDMCVIHRRLICFTAFNFVQSKVQLLSMFYHTSACRRQYTEAGPNMILTKFWLVFALVQGSIWYNSSFVLLSLKFFEQFNKDWLLYTSPFLRSMALPLLGGGGGGLVKPDVLCSPCLTPMCTLHLNASRVENIDLMLKLFLAKPMFNKTIAGRRRTLLLKTNDSSFFCMSLG